MEWDLNASFHLCFYCAGTLAAHWQAAAMLADRKPPRCRELIQASLKAAIDRAQDELSALTDSGIVCVTGSLHAVAQAIRLCEVH